MAKVQLTPRVADRTRRLARIPFSSVDSREWYSSIRSGSTYAGHQCSVLLRYLEWNSRPHLGEQLRNLYRSNIATAANAATTAMSTFFATYKNWNHAQGAVQELVNGGVSPDDLSLIVCRTDSEKGDSYGIRQTPSSVGDGTAFVGRADDPTRDSVLPERRELNELTTLEMSQISPVDTSNISTDVESVDQMDEPQEEMEREMRPRGGISQGEHESDDLALTVLTGFPTPVPGFDDVKGPEFDREEQYTSALETLEIPHVGWVEGGGSLATAALGFAQGEGDCNPQGLVAHLIDDGVPEATANELLAKFKNGDAILAVVVTPGELNEDAVEEIAIRNGGLRHGLFDAPRFYDATLR